MRLAVLLGVVLLLPMCATRARPVVSQGGFVVHDLLPEFWQFWAAAENQPVERQAELWQRLYVQPHRAVFAELAGPCRDQYEPAWALTRYFPRLPSVVPPMREATRNLPEKLMAARRRFLEAFPDMQWAGDVYVMASGFCFDGRAQDIQGRGAILFGMETWVALGQSDLAPTMTHELYHRYHFSFFDFEPSRGYPLWTQLWTEGMAQYVTEELNPGASEADLGDLPAGMVQRVDGRRRELAADFMRKFDSTEDADAKAYFNDMNHQDPLVPARGGYRLGSLVVRELAKGHPIRTMAHWSQSDARPKIREALAAIAGVSERH